MKAILEYRMRGTDTVTTETVDTEELAARMTAIRGFADFHVAHGVARVVEGRVVRNV